MPGQETKEEGEQQDPLASETELLGTIDALQSEIEAQRTEIHDLRLELEAVTPATTPRTGETPRREEEVVASASSSFSSDPPEGEMGTTSKAEQK
jgi:hypothetical protein